MMLITAVREAQIPLVSAMLLGGCAAKLVRTLRLGSMDVGLGATALFPLRARRPVAMAMCAIEFGLGAGLIATAGHVGVGWPANSVRLGAGVLFLVAASALLELRDTRPDVGCGCFGEFSTAPVSVRTIARAALLAIGAFVTIDMPPLQVPHRAFDLAPLLGIFVAELAVLAVLSPELAEALVRLGYSEPCELRVLSEDRTLSSLRRSTQWRKHARVITADVPVDMWRELCWRYVAFASRGDGRDTEVVFAVYMRPRRPPVHAALVDAATGQVLPWPAQPVGLAWPLGLAGLTQLAGLAWLAWLAGLARLAGLAGLARPARLGSSNPAGPAARLNAAPAACAMPGAAVAPGAAVMSGAAVVASAAVVAGGAAAPGSATVSETMAGLRGTVEPLLAAPAEPDKPALSAVRGVPDLRILPPAPLAAHPLGTRRADDMPFSNGI